MKLRIVRNLAASLLIGAICTITMVGCQPTATTASSDDAETTPTAGEPEANQSTTGGEDEAVDYQAQIATAAEIEDKAERVEALGKIAVAAAENRDLDATVAALEEIKSARLAGSGREEDLTPLEKWTRDAAMAIARSKKDPNVGIRIVEKFASSDPIKFKQLTDDVMVSWTKVPGDVRSTITRRIPGLQ